MVKQALKQIGLTDGEIKVYLALLELGFSTTGKITKKSNISGSKVYEVLERLIQKGMVSFVIKNNIKYFEVTSPKRIIDYLEEKESHIIAEKNSIEKIIPELILKTKSAQKSEVKVFTSWEGLKTVNEDIINSLNRGEEWLSMGLTEQPEPWEIYFNKRQEARAKKGILHKHLINKKYKSLCEQRKRLPYTKVRFLSEEFEMPMSTEIYKNKVVIMVLLENAPMAMMIENKAVAKSFKIYFNHLWKNSKINN